MNGRKMGGLRGRRPVLPRMRAFQVRAGEPGIGMAAARWLNARDVVMIGADTWAIALR